MLEQVKRAGGAVGAALDALQGALAGLADLAQLLLDVAASAPWLSLTTGAKTSDTRRWLTQAKCQKYGRFGLKPSSVAVCRDDVANIADSRPINFSQGFALSALAPMLPQLRSSANQAMWNAWHGAGLHLGTPSEVACIKNLIQVALPQVDAVWRASLQQIGLQAKLRGVVCHGHPWVRYPGALARCELGDFLLVHDHQRGSGPLERRAVIVQAKVFHRSGVLAKNPIQLDLYQRWPRFTYESWPGGISNLASMHASAGLMEPLPVLRERELNITGVTGGPRASPAMLDDGCRYGMIDVEHSRWGDPLTGMNPWRLCSALAHDVYSSKAGFTLGGYLVRLMAGQVGRHVPYTQWPASLSVACHWSLMVTELLSILPGGPVSASGNIAFLAATPNLTLTPNQYLQASPIAGDGPDEGAFGIIQVQTSEDTGDPSRREDEARR